MGFGRWTALASLLTASSCGSDPGHSSDAGNGADGDGSAEGGVVAAPKTDWAKVFDAHSLFTDQGPAVAVDAAGNLYSTGSLHGPSGSFGGAMLTRPTEKWDDVFVASFTPAGGHRWSKRFGGDYGDDGQAIAVDAAGNVVVVGFLAQPGVDFGGGALPRSGGFVASFSSDGMHRWSRAFSDPSGWCKAWAVAVDEKGSVFVAGKFWGAADFGGGVVMSNGATFDKGDGYVASYDAAGKYQWAKKLGGGEGAAARAVAAASGVVAVAGSFRGTIDFGTGPLTATPDTGGSVPAGDAYVGILTTAGAPVWAARFGSASGKDDEDIRGATMDANGNALVAGTFGRTGGGAVDFGGGPLGGGGYGNTFVASFTRQGAHRWSKALGTPDPTSEFGAAVDAAGNFYVAGAFDQGRYAVSFRNDGGERWWKRAVASSGSYLYAFAIAVDPSAVYVTGHLTGTVDLGGGTSLTGGAQQIFLTRLIQP